MRLPPFVQIRSIFFLILSIPVYFVLSPKAPLAAQGTPQQDPQAATIMRGSLSSMGAASYSQGTLQTTSGAAVQDSQAKGTISFGDGSSGDITIKTKGLGLLRHDIKTNGDQITSVTNGNSGHVVQGGNKTDLPLWIIKYQRAGHIPVLSRMAEYAQANTNLTYVGLETVAGASVHHIRISSLPTDDTPADLEDLISEFHVFVDVNSLLPVKTLSFALSPQAMQNRAPIETYYSDYRPVGGILVPFHVTSYLRGQKLADIVLSSVELNVGLSVNDFQ